MTGKGSTVEITVVHIMGVLIALLSAVGGYLAKTVLDHNQRLAVVENIISERRVEREQQTKTHEERLSHIAELIEVENQYLKKEIEKLSSCLIRLHERMDGFMQSRDYGRTSGAYNTVGKP